MGTAWEDSVNASFVESVGQYLANLRDPRNNVWQEEIIDELVDHYEMTIGDLPEGKPYDEEES